MKMKTPDRAIMYRTVCALYVPIAYSRKDGQVEFTAV